MRALWHSIQVGLLLIGLCQGNAAARALTPADAEMMRATQRLADLAKDREQEGGPTEPPIVFRPHCDYVHQWLTQPCEIVEALVPFDNWGPGSADWHYVALFRIYPPESHFDVQRRKREHIPAHYAALVEFKFISFPYGVIDWSTAHVVGDHVLVQTKHFLPTDAHFAPSLPGTVEVDVENGGIKLVNLPR